MILLFDWKFVVKFISMVEKISKNNDLHREKNNFGYRTEEALTILNEEINGVLQMYETKYKNERYWLEKLFSFSNVFYSIII